MSIFSSVISHILIITILFLFSFCTTPTLRKEKTGSAAEKAELKTYVDAELLLRSYDTMLSILAEEDLVAALSFLESGAEIPSDDADIMLAQLYLGIGEINQAREMINRAQKRDPDNSTVLFVRAQIAMYSGDLAYGMQLLERALHIDPANTRAMNALGVALLQEGKYKDAEHYFKTSLEHEKTIDAHLGLANVYLRLKKHKQAVTLLDTVVSKNPDNYLAYAERGLAHTMLHNFERAERDFSHSIKLEPDYSWNYFDRGRVRLEQRKFLAAEEDLNVFIEKKPDIFLSYFIRAQIRDRLDRFQEALQDFEQVLALRMDFYPAFIPLGVLYYESDQLERASEQFQAYYKATGGQYPEYALLAATTMMENRKQKQAKHYLDTVFPVIEKDSVFFGLFQLFMEQVNEQRIKSTIASVDDNVTRYRLQFYLGIYYDLQGYLSSALSLYQNVEKHGMQGYAETRLATWKVKTGETEENS